MDAGVGISKYGLQPLYRLRTQGAQSDVALIYALDQWQGTGRYEEGNRRGSAVPDPDVGGRPGRHRGRTSSDTSERFSARLLGSGQKHRPATGCRDRRPGVDQGE
jgi:hypothetical protein